MYSLVVPPQGSLIRDLVLTAYSVFTDYELFNAYVSLTGERLLINADENVVKAFLKEIFSMAIENAKLKTEKLKVYSPATGVTEISS